MTYALTLSLRSSQRKMVSLVQQTQSTSDQPKLVHGDPTAVGLLIFDENRRLYLREFGQNDPWLPGRMTYSMHIAQKPKNNELDIAGRAIDAAFNITSASAIASPQKTAAELEKIIVAQKDTPLVGANMPLKYTADFVALSILPVDRGIIKEAVAFYAATIHPTMPADAAKKFRVYTLPELRKVMMLSDWTFDPALVMLCSLNPNGYFLR